MAERSHRFRCRVYWEDTDAGGIVYYANYLKFAERARTEMLRDAGVEQQRLKDEQGLLFAVKRCACEYVRPARLDDALDVVTSVTAARGASLDMRQEIRRADELLASLDVTIACLSATGAPSRMPANLRNALAILTASHE
jgi:acyl-CoA thioester hydrolase